MVKRIFIVGFWLFICVNLSFAQWQVPFNLGPTVNSSSDDRRPSVSYSGDTLYFSSDRPGGQGGFDIWMTVKVGGVWNTPVNLGPPINTANTDFLPSINNNGDVLYFISDRLGGLGGYDVWVSTNVGGVWTAPVNLTAVNSAATE